MGDFSKVKSLRNISKERVIQSAFETLYGIRFKRLQIDDTVENVYNKWKAAIKSLPLPKPFIKDITGNRWDVYHLPPYFLKKHNFVLKRDRCVSSDKGLIIRYI